MDGSLGRGAQEGWISAQRRGSAGGQGCLQKHVELPPSISVTHVGFRDGWLPGGSSTTPVDSRALYAPGTKQDNKDTQSCRSGSNTKDAITAVGGWKMDEISRGSLQRETEQKQKRSWCGVQRQVLGLIT
ncbi:unnamed protein product [Pleuronectes platessa]|uniref:Uncharacterized protein n=1 Tax=Pleuronectes platessa TaxID=8262 RepID=A0A9N7VTF0_PLEPL|nr:unnamed protein product [Pleuronectes platessa]